MLSKLTVFAYEEFDSIRAITIDGQPWFIGKDVARALGYENGSRDINRHVDEDDRQNYRNGTSEINNRGMTIINESGLYSLILSSKLSAAKKFKRWVTAEVLPSLHKTGHYSTGNASMEVIPEIIAQIVTTAVEHIIAEIPTIVHATIKAAQPYAQRIQRPEPTAATEYLNLISVPQTKVETFPPEIRGMVDEILYQMQLEANVNFSQVARICTIKGYSVTSPAIKRYYNRRFGNQ